MARRGENIRKRKDGRWEARFICGYQENGRAKYKYVYRRTYTEVKEARNRMMSQKAGTRASEAEHAQEELRFASLLADWLQGIRREVKDSTYSRYSAVIEKHICPELGRLPLSELTEKEIDSFARKKLSHGNLKKSGGLSPKTVEGMLSVIRLALDHGARKGYPCCRSVRVCSLRQKMPEIQIFTLKEQKRLEQALMEENGAFRLGILTSLYLGLRIGEICGLRWEDLDLENGLLYVRRSVQRISNLSWEAEVSLQAKTRIIIDTPKTNSSVREIPIPPFLLPLYRQHQADGDFFVLTGSSSCVEPRLYYRRYKTLLKKCGLEHFNYHALRHTFATRCVESGFDVKSLSEILGHANVSTTLQRYVHPPLSLKRRHMERLGPLTDCGQRNGQKEEETPEL